MSNDPTRPLPQQPLGRYPAPPRRRRRRSRRSVIALFSLVVLLVVLIIADQTGRAIAENDFATQAEKSGIGVKPTVGITGFPFLTQLAARDFRKVTISARNVPAGPLRISSINATATGVRINSSFNGATVDHITGNGMVTFAALGNAMSGGGSGGGGGGGGTGLVTVSKAGPSEVRVTAGGLVSEDATIERTGPSTVAVHIVNGGDLLSGALSSLGSFSFTVPQLPAGMAITGLNVTAKGLVMSFAASHTTLSE